MRLLAALGALSLALSASPACARAYTVEDLLATESINGAVLDPGGRWAVIAHSPAWSSAPRFDHVGRTALTLGKLDLVDLLAPSAPQPLFPHETGAGYSAGPVSPSGRYMLVFRLKEHVWTAGVVTVAQRRVLWLAATPEFPVYGRVAQWRSDEELLLIDRPSGVAPRQLRLGWDASARLPALWAAQARGKSSTASVVGSGSYLGRKPAPHGTRLLRVAPETGRTSPLAEGEFIDLEISPGGRHVALFSNAENMQPTAQDRVTASFPTRRRSLKLLDLQTGRVSEPCAGCDFHLRLLSWSPDGHELMATRRGSDPERPELVRIGANDLKVTHPNLGALEPNLAYTGEGAPLIAADWLGRDPIIYARPAAGGRSDWYRLSDARPLNLTAQLPATPRRLGSINGPKMQILAGETAWTVDGQGRAVRLGDDRLAPTKSAPTPGLGARFAAKPMVHDAPLVAQRSSPDEEVLVTLLPRRRALGRLGPSDSVLTTNRDVALVQRRTTSGVTSVEVLRPGGGPREVLTINRSLADVTAARIRAITHRAPTGELLTSWLYLPVATTPNGRKPSLVVMPYPSEVFPRPALSTLPGELRFPVHPQVLVGAGYAVLMPSLPFNRVASEPMRGLADQILKITDEAVATGEVDGERLGLLGHSFGAYAAMASATQTNRFKAIVAVAGISDLVSYWGVMPTHYRVAPDDGLFFAAMAGLAERGHPHQEGPPWRDPSRYVRNSPLFAADKISTPLMLIHGDQDEVGFNQSEEMFAALYRQGKTAQLVTYWGEGHAMLSPANVRDLYTRVLGFLADNLSEGHVPTSAGGPRPVTIGAGHTAR